MKHLFRMDSSQSIPVIPIRDIKTLRAAILAAVSVLAVTVTHAVPVKLLDGSVLEGKFVNMDDSTVTVQTQSLGRVRIRLNQVATTRSPGSDTLAPERAVEMLGQAPAMPASPGNGTAEPVGAQSAGSPADQALFFMPTAFTPQKGTISFRDFELLFLTLGISPTNTTSITGGFLFPVSSDVQLLTVGLKQQLWMSGDSRTAVAATANFTKPFGQLSDAYSGVFTSNLVASYRLPDADDPKQDGTGMHLALGYLGGSSVGNDYYGKKITHWEDTYSFAAGAEARITPYAKAIVECLSGAPFDPNNDLHGGLLTFGVRLHGSRLGADIAAMRPITDSDLGTFVLWPLLIVTYRL